MNLEDEVCAGRVNGVTRLLQEGGHVTTTPIQIRWKRCPMYLSHDEYKAVKEVILRALEAAGQPFEVIEQGGYRSHHGEALREAAREEDERLSAFNKRWNED